jgi:predicted phage-related endonuclease
MQRNIIKPLDRNHWLQLRTLDVTSSEVGALFDCSPHLTAFELWHQKKDSTLIENVDNRFTRWGIRLQSPIAYGMAEDFNLDIEKFDDYIRIPELKIGSSFDFKLKDSRILFEIKNVGQYQFKNSWLIEDSHIEAPAHIELQIQHQLLVSDFNEIYLGVLVGGNDSYLIKRTRNDKIIDGIINEVKAFWSSITDNREPIPNFDRDARFIFRLYNYAEPGKVLNAMDNEELRDLVNSYLSASKSVKEAEKMKNYFKAEILSNIGDHERVSGNGFTISAGVTGESDISYTRKPYRRFHVREKKYAAR